MVNLEHFHLKFCKLRQVAHHVFCLLFPLKSASFLKAHVDTCKYLSRHHCTRRRWTIVYMIVLTYQTAYWLALWIIPYFHSPTKWETLMWFDYNRFMNMDPNLALQYSLLTPMLQQTFVVLYVKSPRLKMYKETESFVFGTWHEASHILIKGWRTFSSKVSEKKRIVAIQQCTLKRMLMTVNLINLMGSSYSKFGDQFIPLVNHIPFVQFWLSLVYLFE